jgi:hypothetical protein
MRRWTDSIVLKTESFFRPKHRNIVTTRRVNPKENRQTIDTRPENLKTSVDCVGSENGGEKLRRNNCNKLLAGRA